MFSNLVLKRFISGFVSFSLIFGSTGVFAAGTPTPVSATGSVSCALNSEAEYFPVGDSRGNNILTKREVIRDCNVTVVQQGACIKWRESNVDRGLGPDQYNAFESNNYADTLGSLLSALGAYDQIEHLWSGWKGYCEIGTKSDFSWAEDPMFWASMAMSLIMSTSEPGGLTSGTSVGNGFNGMADSLGGVMQSAGEGMGQNLAEGAANQAVDTLANAAVESGTTLTESAVNSAISTATEKFYNDMGRCLIAGGFEIATTLYEFAQSDGSTNDCDPVDEVCGGIDPDEGLSSSDITTMDETQFNDLVTQFSSSEPPQNIYDYVTVIPPSPENGIISFRMKKLNEMSGVSGMDQEAMKDLQNKAKEMQMQISLGMTALSMAGCLTGAKTADIGQPNTDEDRASLRAGASFVIDTASKYLGPWGPVVGAALKVVLYVATSYKSIDTCHDEDDAKEAGKREERTQKSLKFNLCHLVDIECAEHSALATGAIFSSPCVLDGYNYCCYDQIMSKILVEQLKAQLGRDWAHCTGITIRDLNYVSFKQCTPAQITEPGTIDGAHQTGIYDPTKAFQYKSHCIDMGEFLEYLNAQMSSEIDMADFESFWNDITEQSPYGGTIP